MEGMVLSLAEAATAPLLKKLGTFLAEEVELLAGVEDDARFIVDELKSMISFLKVASSRNNHDEQIKTYIQQVNEMAYDAEDAIDSLEYHGRSLSFLNKAWLLLSKLKAPLHDIARDLKKLKLRARDVSERRNRYYFSHDGGAGAAAVSGDYLLPSIQINLLASYNPSSTDVSGTAGGSDPKRLLFPLLAEETKPVGFKEHEDYLMRQLLNGEECPDLQTIMLCGSPGLGKTTLAEHVYRSREVNDGRFSPLAWISVSKAYDTISLLRIVTSELSISTQDICAALGRSRQDNLKINKLEETELLTVLKEYLEEKRYLIVLDDLLSVKAWEDIKLALPQGKSGSRIIVTTFVKEVTEAYSASNNNLVLRIKPLHQDEARNLFLSKVLIDPDGPGDPDDPEYVNLENLRDENLRGIIENILKKCSGSPLAIITVAGLLAAKPKWALKKPEEWKKLDEPLCFNLEGDPTMVGLEKVLTVAYNDLPRDVKPCFLYLSVFPKYYKISKKRLLRRWVAEGLVSERYGMSAEQVGGTYFDELLIRNLISPHKVGSDGRVRSFTVNNISVEIIVSISMQQNFVTVLNDRSPSTTPHGKIRRLSIHETGNITSPLKLYSHVRSLTTFGDYVHLRDYSNMGLLRVLDLDGCKNLSCDDLTNISKLFLLTFLSLRNSSIDKLPVLIGNLLSLRVLDIRGTRIEKLPATIVKLHNLNYLLGGSRSSQSGKKANCIRMPKGLGKMTKLRNLGVIDGSNQDDPYSHVLQEIGKLTNLDKLKIRFSKGFPDDERNFCESLSKLSNCLRSLHIFVDGGGTDVRLKKALRDLKNQPVLLRSIYLEGRMETLPHWFSSLRHLTDIFLENTFLKQRVAMQILKDLPALLKLVLRGDSFPRLQSMTSSSSGDVVDQEEVLDFESGGFAWLRMLQVQSLRLNFQSAALPKLEMLTLNDYSCLRKEKNVISGLTNLKKLRIVVVDIGDDEILRTMLATDIEKISNYTRWNVATNI